MRTLILGLGGQGIECERLGLDVARGLHTLLADPDVDIIESYGASMNLFDVAAGYEKVVVVDCIRTGQGDVGELRKLGLSDLDLVPARRGEGGSEYRATVQLEGVKSFSVPLEISIYAIELGADGGTLQERASFSRDAVTRLVAQIAREEFGAGSSSGDWY